MNEQVVVAAVGGLALVVLGLVAVWQAFRHWYVSVNPDEYVVHYRGGRVKHLGRGLSFFCLPGDTFLRVPSTIRDINFVADQITQEKQGVRVQGFLAYKIADFDVAYQSLDLKAKSMRVLRACEQSVQVTDYQEKNCEEVVALDPEDPLAKTDLVIRRLAESVVRHEVAGKSVEEMITERESVIQSMRTQLQETVQHWGIEIDTIEFTEVWIRSRELFEHLQSGYRNEMKLTAAESHAATERAIAEKNLQAEQEIALLQAESERIRRIRTSEEQRTARTTEIGNNAQLEELEITEQSRLERQRLERKQELDRLAKEKEFELRQKELELARAEELARLEAEIVEQQERHKVELDRRAKATELEERKAETARKLEELAKRNEIESTELRGELEVVMARLAAAATEGAAERRRIQVEAKAREIERLAEAKRKRAHEKAEGLRLRGDAQAEALEKRTRAENLVEPQNLKRHFIEELPRIAESMKVKDVRWVNVSGGEGGGSPMEMVPQALARALGVFQGMGVDLGEILSRGTGGAGEALPEGDDEGEAA